MMFIGNFRKENIITNCRHYEGISLPEAIPGGTTVITLSLLRLPRPLGGLAITLFGFRQLQDHAMILFTLSLRPQFAYLGFELLS